MNHSRKIFVVFVKILYLWGKIEYQVVSVRFICRGGAAWAVVVVLGFLSSCLGNEKKSVSLATLFDEMASVEETARYPEIAYRTFTLSGRAENVMFDQRGPGVITRIRLASDDKRGVVRFYFDGASSADITLAAYDLSLLNIPEAEGGLLTADGSVLYLPLPYDKHCKITFEEAPEAEPTPKYYQISYRQYPENMAVETYSSQKVSRMKRRIADINRLLLNPDSIRKAEHLIQGEAMLEAGSPLVIKLPGGEHAVYGLQLQVTPSGGSDYAQGMRDMILQGIFDGKLTVRAPVSDFSGGGMGAPYVKSRYLSADGKGVVFSRWLMPYREKASLSFINEGRGKIHIRYTFHVSPLAWDDRTLYFHASWKEETGLHLGNRSEGDEWNFATLSGGRGVYKGDVLTLYNHTTAWYGEGIAGIRVDGDALPSHTENTAGDYFNAPQIPVTPFHTPFGGAPRADLKSSHGYNTFFRTRILDHIPFTTQFRFDMGLSGRKAGTVDYATTVFWYGDRKVRPEKTSRPETWARALLPSPATESEESSH
jgi:hypothetical protein